MRDRTQTVLGDILPPEERAIESVVARYQRVAPAITRFARSLAQNDELRVRLGSEAASRPGEVVLDPRLFQAAYSRNAPVTPSEVALASALHEVVHLAVTDFEEKRPIPEEWLPERDQADDEDRDLDKPVALLDALSRAGGAPAGREAPGRSSRVGRRDPGSCRCCSSLAPGGCAARASSRS